MSFDPRLPDERVNVSSGSAAGEAAWLLAGLLGIAVAAVTLLAVGVDVAVRWLPPGVEARWLGGWADSAMEDSASAVDPRRESVQQLLDRLARHWPDAPYRFRAAVVDETESNAFALPGGWVVVTSGLLDRIHTENELAFVLGHELGHFRNRDHLRGLGRGVAWGIVSAGLGFGDRTASTLAGVAGGLSSRHFDRGQESQADRVGLDLLHAEYGHVAGASAVFDRVLSAREGEPADEADPDPTGTGGGRLGGALEVLSGYLSTHPSDGDRVQQLAAIAGEQGWRTDGEQTPWPATAPACDQGTPSPE